MNDLLEMISRAHYAVALTGAGISTLCGIPDFRGPQGLYQQPDAERIFDIDWFRRDPAIYYQGCRTLVYGLRQCQPGPVHQALARLEHQGLLKGIITQNIDMLHQKSGSRKLIEIHGSPLWHHCFDCGHAASFETVCGMLDQNIVARCERCRGAYKPDITFFGEMLPEAALEEAIQWSKEADLMIVLGTSLTVHPAASLPLQTLRAGGDLIIINAQPTPLDRKAIRCYSDLVAFSTAITDTYPAP